MATVQIEVGEYLFEFSSFEQWINKAQSWFVGYSGVASICVDAKGRLCPSGKEFMRARDEGSFPIKVYMQVIESEVA